LLALPKVASVFAFGFMVSPVVDHLALGITLYMVGGSVRDGGNA
jgi:hypothetical protein